MAKMNIKNINMWDTITIETGVELCQHFDMPHLVNRLTINPRRYEAFKFNGYSNIPDNMENLLDGCRWDDITYKCFMPYELGYAYGEIGDKLEKEAADMSFYYNLIEKAGVKPFYAAILLRLIDIEWGFANKKRKMF